MLMMKKDFNVLLMLLTIFVIWTNKLVNVPTYIPNGVNLMMLIFTNGVMISTVTKMISGLPPTLPTLNLTIMNGKTIWLKLFGNTVTNMILMETDILMVVN